MKSYPSKRFVAAAMAVVIASCAGLAVSAAEIPANAWYGDGFDLSATHTLGSSFSNNSTPAAPQINNTGTAVGWTGFAPQEMKYNTRANGTWNSGATGGVISVTRNEQAKTTTYLAAIPFDAIGLSAAVLQSGFRFNVLVNDNDGEMRESFITIAPGIAFGKTPEHFPLVNFRSQSKD